MLPDTQTLKGGTSVTTESNEEAFDLALQEVASEGVKSEREQLILWVIRNRHDLSPEESYEFVLEPGELVEGLAVDAAFVVVGRDVISPVYVIVDESWRALKKRAGMAIAALQIPHPEQTFAKRSPRLRSVFASAIESEVELDRLVMCVCTKALSAAARTQIEAEGSESSTELDVLDMPFLLDLAKADAQPTSSIPPMRIEARRSSVLDLDIPGSRAVVLPIDASQIAAWPGVEERTLFDLNVRHALGANRVRRSLDAALSDLNGAGDFIAFHNGITAICRRFAQDDNGLSVDGFSVVNGAQTVIAIHSNRDRLADGIRVLLKLVEASPNSDLARNIAVRSNTQNPVTSRNLRALDATQERLRSDAKRLDYLYLVRPDDKEARNDRRVIRNDDAAQLLCSMYQRKPALAVKRQVLFEAPNYFDIFPETLDIERIVFAHIVREVVERARKKAPEPYQSAWSLTALTLFYMTSEALRSDPEFAKIVEDPREVIQDSKQLRTRLQPFVDAALEVLHHRQAELAALDKPDDFKVDFKQTRTLSDLGMEASRAYRSSGRRKRP